jgi:4-aminobutyrate aminotransferase
VGGDQPLAGVTVKADYQSKLEVGSQPATFPGNALSCAVALTNIDIITDPKDELIKRAELVGGEIKSKFQKAAEPSPIIGEVRGKGFMLSCELVKNKKTKEPINAEKSFGIMLKLRDNGVLNFICGRYGNVFRFMPPLTISKAYFEKATDIFLNILKENEEDLMK